MIEASGLEEVPEAFFVSTCGSGHSCLGKRREIEQAGLKACPDREPGDDYRVFMQAISLSTSSSSVSKEVTSLISPMASFQK